METKTLRDYLRIVFRRKALIVIATITVIVATYFKVQMMTPYYSATVKMLVFAEKITKSEYYQGIGMGRYTANHVELMRSQAVLNRVVKALTLYQRPLDFDEIRLASNLKRYLIDQKIKDIKNQVGQMPTEEKNNFLFGYALTKLSESFEAVALEKSSLLEVTVRDYNPEMAVIIANALSRSYIIFDLEQQVEDLQLQYGDKNITVIKLKDYVEELHKTLDGKLIPNIEALGLPTLKIVSQAQFPVFNKPVEKKNALIFALAAGILLGIIIAITVDLLDQTFKSPQEVENILKMPLLGSIPKRKLKKEVLISHINTDSSDYSRSFQNISDQIVMLMTEKKMKSFLFIDAEGSDGTAAIIANIGVCLANRKGNKVLVIDANLRNPSLSAIFDIPNSPGLTEVLGHKIDFMAAVKDLDANLHFLPAGETEFNPTILQEPSLLSDLIENEKEFYNIILVSCADIKNYTDSVSLSSKMDGVILVVNEGNVRRQVVKGAIAPLEHKEVNMVGAILNNRTYSLPGIIYRLT